MRPVRVSLSRAAFAALASLLVCACRVLGGPAVFADLKLDDALARSKEEGRILVVKGTAEWCGPCKQMDRTAWVDPRVEAWFKDHGLAIAVDVDKSPAEAKRLKIRAMPTMIAFRDGVEVDRIVGGRGADKLLAWLEGVEAGKTAGGRAESGRPADVMERFRLARSLSDAGKLDEATEEFLWLWEHALEHDPAFAGVRQSYMTTAMGELANQHLPAHLQFARLRDRLEAKLRSGDATMDNLVEWAALTVDTLDEPERLVAWYDRVKDDAEAGPSLRRLGFRLQPVLLEEERYADAGRLLKDPPQEVQTIFSQVAMAAGALPPEDREQYTAYARDQVATSYACLLAAGRDEEGQRVAEALLASDDTGEARVALVEWALEVEEPRASQRALLDAAEARGADVADLKAELEEALEEEKE